MRNLETVMAEAVAVEIELQTGTGQRVEFDRGLVDGLDVPLGEERSFQVIMQNAPG
jgi:hypothetical protein